MRLGRRGLLQGLSAGALAFVAGSADARSRIVTPGPRTVTVRATALDAFDLRDSGKRDFGALRFRGGLRLQANDPDFGGFSSLRLLTDDGRFLTLSDRGTWMTGRLVEAAGRPTAIVEAQLAPALDVHGRALSRTRSYDTESMAFHDGALYVGVERTNEILRFDWPRHGVLAHGVSIPLPARAKQLPNNRGFEALGSMPRHSPAPGSLIAIAERSGGADEPTLGFLIGGRQAGMFSVVRHDGFDVSDLDFLPSGDLILLERRFTWISGVAMRLRRIPLAAIRPGAVLDGEILIEADRGYEIDNMEGLSIRSDAAGQTVFTLISDDNFSALQRTILLQFQWLGS